MKAKTRTNQPIEHLVDDVKEVVESASDGTLDKVLGLDSSSKLVKGSTGFKKYVFSGYVGQGYDFSLTEDEWKSIKGVPYFLVIKNTNNGDIAYISYSKGVENDNTKMPQLDGYTLFSKNLSENMIMFKDQEYVGEPITLEIYCFANPDIVPVETTLFSIEL